MPTGSHDTKRQKAVVNKNVAKRSLSTSKSTRAKKKDARLTPPDLMSAIQMLLSAEPDHAHLLEWIKELAKAQAALMGICLMSARQQVIVEAGGDVAALQKIIAEQPLALTAAMDVAQDEANRAVHGGRVAAIDWLDRYTYGNAKGKE